MLKTSPSRRCSSQPHLARLRAGEEQVATKSKAKHRRSSLTSHLRKSCNTRTQRDRRRSNVVSRFQCTQQYSIIALTDETGNIKERYAYDAYGAPTILDANGVELATSAENNRYMYTGREWDQDLGLYYYRARMYDPYSGRFCSRDPIGFDGGDWNLYSYVGQRPLSFVDPSGLFDWQPSGPGALPPRGGNNPMGEPDSKIKEICKKLAQAGGKCGGCGANCEKDLKDLFENAKNHTSEKVKDNCLDWVTSLPKLRSPCYSTEAYVWKYPFTGIPYLNDPLRHVAIKVTLCDGTVFYMDNGAWGHGNNIFNWPHNIFPILPVGPFPIPK